MQSVQSLCKFFYLSCISSGKHWRQLYSTNPKKLPVVKIWRGMSVSEIISAANVSHADLSEAMQKAKIKKLESIEDAKLLLTLLQREFDVVATPEKKVPGKIDLLSVIESSVLQPGKNLVKRPAIVTIMGHVDHGKTTLLDALRHSELVKQEFGGITQHIGAFVVTLNGERMTVLDTPGHAAFASMRQRGTNVTDIVILVVAADDGVMLQTIESINYAKKASVPIIVAVNKIDKVDDLDRSMQLVKSGLFTQGIILEEDGGDTQAIGISALNGQGLNQLKEAVIALAEMLQLSAFGDGKVEGTVIDACVHPHRGKVATVLTQNGTLKKGDVIIAGETNISFAKVRTMYDEYGKLVEQVLPGSPVQITGWRNDVLPSAGDKVVQVLSEKHAKNIFSIAENIRKQNKFEEGYKIYEINSQKERQLYKEALNAKRAAGLRYRKLRTGPRQKQIIDDPEDNKKLHIIVKADVDGTLEVLLNLFHSYPNNSEEIKLHVIHSEVGAVTEKDIQLASCFKNTFVYAFNVNTLSQAADLSKELSVSVRNFNVIYKLVDDLKCELSSRLPPAEVEEIVGEAVVLQEFLVNEKNKKIAIAGCRCLNGSLRKDLFFKLKRGESIVHEKMQIVSMRNVKNEVTIVNKDTECGLRFTTNSDENVRFRQTDSIICYQLKKVNQTTNWNPEGF